MHSPAGSVQLSQSHPVNGQLCCAGSDKEDQLPQGQFNGFNGLAMAPTTAQPVTPGFLDAGPAQEEGVLHQLAPVCVVPACEMALNVTHVGSVQALLYRHW